MAYFLIFKNASVEEYATKPEMETAIEKKIRDRATLPDSVIKGKKYDYSYLIKVKLSE